MAELGDLSNILSQGTEKPVEITAEMLDFDFIEECEDVAKLRGIFQKLTTNEFGHYPELEKAAKAKLFSKLPAAEQKKMKRLEHVTTAEEVADAQNMVRDWESSVRRKDESILGRDIDGDLDAARAADSKTNDIFDTTQIKVAPPRKRNLPPVRGSGEPAETRTVRAAAPKPSSPGEKETKDARLSGYDFPAWEKFDVEAAEAAVDMNENFSIDSLKPGKSTQQLRSESGAKRAQAHQKEMDNLLRALGADGLTQLQRSTRANREKIKGNECFRIGETQEAFDCYSRSLALDRTNPITYANRAMAAIRLERYELAEDDCTRAIALDSSYLKAWSRRGMTRFKRGNFSGAAEDFDTGLKLDPSSTELRKLWESARQKYLEVEGRSLPSRDASDPTSVELVCVKNIGDLRIPPSSARELTHGRCTVTRPVAAEEVPQTFTRIAISADSDSDSDSDSDVEEVEAGESRPVKEQEQEPEKTESKQGFKRIAIVEDSDSESDSEDEQAVAPPVPVPTEKSAAQIAADKDRASEFKMQGNAHMKSGSHREAIYAYTQALNLDPKLVAALNNRAMAYLAQGQSAEVVTDTNAVLELETDNCKAMYRRAVAQLRLGKLSEAEADINRVLQLDPKNSQAASVKRQVTDAIRGGTPSSAPAPAPAPAPVHTELDMKNVKKMAMDAMDEGDCAGAARVLETALRTDYFKAAGVTENLEMKVSMLHLAHLAYLRDGNSVESQKALERILAIQPNNFKAMLKCAQICLQLDQRTRAAELARSALEIDPTNVEALQLQSRISKDLTEVASSLKARGNEAMADKQYSRAVELYTEAIAADPASVVAVNNRAQAYLKLGSYDKAIEDATTVIHRTEGQDVHSAVYRKALFRRAFSHREQTGPKRNIEAALADFKLLVSLEPANKGFVNELQRTEAMLQQQHQHAVPPQPPAEEIDIGLTAKSTTLKKPAIEVVEEAVVSAESLAQSLSPGADIEGSGSGAAVKRATKASVTKVSPLKRPDVPTAPPKTVYEMEKVWRALKNYPDLFAEYLSIFKRTTYKKVFKDSLSSDLLTSVFQTLHTHATPAVAAATLQGLATTTSFSMMLQLLPASDLVNLRASVEKIAAGQPELASQLRETYKL